jgi:hypothetical protein
MRVLGVDLAEQADKTGAIMLLVPTSGLPKVSLIKGTASDDVLVRLARQADYVGIDAPLGWPVNFVAAKGHRSGRCSRPVRRQFSTARTPDPISRLRELFWPHEPRPTCLPRSEHGPPPGRPRAPVPQPWRPLARALPSVPPVA